MPATAESVKTKNSETSDTSGASPIVLDLGKHRRKAIKQLRKGEGKLLHEVQDAIDELKSAGAVATDAQPIIVVVRQKRRRSRGVWDNIPRL